jgi:hypothetical protein
MGVAITVLATLLIIYLAGTCARMSWEAYAQRGSIGFALLMATCSLVAIKAAYVPWNVYARYSEPTIVLQEDQWTCTTARTRDGETVCDRYDRK